MTQAVADQTDSTGLDNPDVHAVRLKDEKSRARQWILPTLLGGYMALLALSVFLPFVFVSQLNADGAAQVKDLMLAGSTVLQGLVSLIAIGVGYYFRESQEHG